MYKVLLVDDEILVREAISAKIQWEQLGFELAGDCENGKEAIAFLEATPVDVVLTDIYMPYVDGMGLSKYIYENMPQTTIIIFSGYGDFDYAKQAIQYKVAEYILKPVTAKELSQVLTRIKGKLDGERRKEEKLDELTKVYHNYTKNESLIVSRILSRLVMGTQAVETSLQEMEEFGIFVEGDVYRVAAIDIDVYSGLYEIDDELKKESALMSFVVENISNEIVNNYKAGLAYRDSDNRVCILFFTDRAKKFVWEVSSICREIKDTVFQVMKLSVSMGIGISVNKLENLSRSYESATKILKYRYTKGSGVIFDCEEPQPVENPMELERNLKDIVSAVRESDEELLKDILNHIEERLKSGYVTRSRAVAYLQQVLGVLHETVYATNENFKLQDSDVSGITEARSLVEAMKLIKNYAKAGMNAVSAAGYSSGELQAIRAMDYIKENYSDPALSLNQICNYLNISTSRFSSIFKEATGKTFMEVLTSVRMERAKQLLRQTSLKNYEIAEKVGFSDPHYFSIAFKKMTGRTPKEYARET
ncbi:helix-turn-helix domain-containing protein [Clostridium sp. C105KSO13]|uniref:helix-turn-helix domain-containing protein n=1 Tax=Clostridium sp. C105KSO13 TaxID=1776045 RepID=UPI0007407830|nr:helix-turn-helix domain-containing protein [Clostridium sp. C105KSO13]CUX36056.1 putative response regulatory protein [Clostridium sp. C105KSO13]